MLLKAVILLECMLSIGSIASNTATGSGSAPPLPPSGPPRPQFPEISTGEILKVPKPPSPSPALSSPPTTSRSPPY